MTASGTGPAAGASGPLLSNPKVVGKAGPSGAPCEAVSQQSGGVPVVTLRIAAKRFGDAG